MRGADAFPMNDGADAMAVAGAPRPAPVTSSGENAVFASSYRYARGGLPLLMPAFALSAVGVELRLPPAM
ncbi:hypothetical protein [Streptomyces sp. NPDC050255]|uniref:hypothetical protein n=1 Tax=Streptomyces sp. NPDC050255 TaxID=3365606 RepID=UPI0037AF1271